MILVVSDTRLRVLSAIRHRAVDRVPKGELCIDDAVIRKELGCHRVGFEERLEFVNRLGLDLICLTPKYPLDVRGIPEARDVLWEDLQRWTGNTPLFSFAIIDGVFGWGIRTLGFERFVTLHVRSPLNLEDLIKRVEALNGELSKIVVEQGINGIIIADDIAYTRGLLTSPKIIREYFIPSLERQLEEIAGKGVPVFFHSDGNYGEIITDLIQIGFEGLHCIDSNSGMDALALQQAYGESLCLWGTLAADDLAKSAEPVYFAELIENIRRLNSGGGFILGTNSGLFEGIDVGRLTEIYRVFG